MSTFLKIYGIAFIIFFIVDILWLSLIAKKLYAQYLGAFLGPVKWVPAILFYLFFVAGLVFFVIQPALLKDSLSYVIFAGMFFGFITYATYDLTNLATINNWPLNITIIDLIWGSVLGGSVSTLTYLIFR
jgi:uncharacterized membrane protein